MRRGVYSGTVLLVAALLLAKPFDCFSSTGMTREAAGCCAKGKCLPTRNSDDCCRKTAPDAKQFVGAASVTVCHCFAVSGPLVCSVPVPAIARLACAPLSTAHSPPHSPPGSNLTIPLLI